jgi:hypothetical protein
LAAALADWLLAVEGEVTAEGELAGAQNSTKEVDFCLARTQVPVLGQN